MPEAQVSSTPDAPNFDPGKFGGDLSSLAKSLDKSSQETSAALAETRPKKMAILDKLMSEKAPTPPEIAPPEKPTPGPEPTDPIRAFGSVASALAIFGSLLSRRPLQTALNASASAMTAIKERDQEAYKKHLDEWKQQSEYAGKVAQWQIDRYHMAMDQHKGNIDELNSTLGAIAAADNDVTMLHALKTGDIRLAESFIKDRQKMINDYQSHQLDVTKVAETQRHDMEMEKSPEKDAYFALRKANPDKDPTEIIRSMKMSAGNIPLAMFLQEHPDATAQDVANFTRSLHAPRSGIGMAMQKYIEENPKADAEDVSKFSAKYGAMQKATRDFATGKQGDTVRAFETVSNHLETLDQLGKALNNNDMVAFNRISNAFAVATGNPAPTNFSTAMQVVGGEITKAVQGTPGGVTDREGARNAFETVKSPDQIGGAIETVRKLVGGQLQSLEHQYADTTGLKDFRTRLHGKSLDLLKFVDKGEAEAGQPLAEPAKAAWGAYEPEKYDYRTDPATGKLQRAPK